MKERWWCLIEKEEDEDNSADEVCLLSLWINQVILDL